MIFSALEREYFESLPAEERTQSIKKCSSIQQLVSAINDENSSPSSNQTASAAGVCALVFTILFFLMSWSFGQFVAQAHANEWHHDVTYSAKGYVLLGALLLLVQTFAVILPIQLCVQKPILNRYKSEGRNIKARRVWGREEIQDKNKKYEVILVYEPDVFNPSVSFGKKIEVTAQEYTCKKETMDIVVIPEVPKSAVLARRVYNTDFALWSVQYVSAVLAITGNLFLVKETKILTQYNPNGFCMWLALAIGWIASVMLAYSVTVMENFEMLHGKSMQYYGHQVDGNEIGNNAAFDSSSSLMEDGVSSPF